MKTPTPRAYTDSKRPKIAFIVEHKSGTRRVRKFFTDEDDAKSYCKGIERKQRQLGFDDAALLSPEAAREAVECIKTLQSIGATLKEATEHFMKWQGAAKASRPVKTAVNQWLDEIERQLDKGEIKQRTAGHYQRIKKFADYFADRPLATISWQEVKKWLSSINGTALTKRHYRAVCATFYSWAIGENIAKENVALQVPAKKKVKGLGKGQPIEPETLQLAFDIATGDKTGLQCSEGERKRLVAWLALGAFAGLRAAEIMRADWRQIKFDKGEILVADPKNEDQPRKVTMTPAAREWLSTVANTKGPVIEQPKFETQGPLIRLREALAKQGHKWPANGLRKAFITCHWLLVADRDGRKTMIEGGHTTEGTAKAYYIGGFDDEKAAEVWAIRPRSKRGKIVKFATA